ncbi:MAG TPA: hypothetical protein VM056_06400 [Terriglobales bacterium]|nr:hypothetical protein [Terriglobales bacterium]
MRKYLTLALAFALSAGIAVAQEPQTTPSTTTPQTDVGQPTDTNEPVFKGCISGTKDNYVLTDVNGKAFRLHSDKDIAEHVGKMVEIRGTVKKEGADRPADAQPASASSEMDVADIKNIEGSCPTSNSSALTTEQPKTETADASAPTATTTEPAPAEVAKNDLQSTTTTTETPAPAAEVNAQASTTDANASAEVKANNVDQTATAPAATETTTEQNAAQNNEQLPETASILPLLGLLGFVSTGLGLVMRRK